MPNRRKTGKDINCQNCGNEFYAPAWWLKRAKYCSRKCYWEAKHDIPWNKGIKTGLANSGSFGSKSSVVPMDIKEYKRLHYRIRSLYGNPEVCEHCGSVENLEWANKTNKYLLDRDDWLQLCSRCHFEYDNVESRRIKNAGN